MLLMDSTHLRRFYDREKRLHRNNTEIIGNSLRSCSCLQSVWRSPTLQTVSRM